MSDLTMHDDDVIGRLKAENAELRHALGELMRSHNIMQVRIYGSLDNLNKLKPTLDTISKDGEIRRLRDELERVMEFVGNEDKESIKAVLEER